MKSTYFTFPATQTDDTYSLNGSWKVDTQEITAGAGAAIRLNHQAAKGFSVLGGTVTVRRDGQVVNTFQLDGQPHLYPIIDGATHERATNDLAVSPDVQACTFIFG